MSDKQKANLCFLIFVIACFTVLIIGQIINSPQPKIQELQTIEIKDDAVYASRVEPWLVPDSFDYDKEEIFSAISLLEAYDIEVTNLDNFISYFEDKNILYEDDMRDSLFAYFRDNDISYQLIAEHADVEDIYELVNAGIPVVSWITNDYKVPRWIPDSNTLYGLYENQQTVIIKEIKTDSIILIDSHSGIKEISKDEFTILYEACGCHALWLKE